MTCHNTSELNAFAQPLKRIRSGHELEMITTAARAPTTIKSLPGWTHI